MRSSGCEWEMGIKAVAALLLAALLWLDVQIGRADVDESGIVRDRVLVVFRADSLPADAVDRVRSAGGEVVESWNSIGALVAKPATVDGAALIDNLLRDSAVMAAEFDRVVTLDNLPEAIAVEEGVSSEGHVAPPALPPDAFYGSPFHWSVKRVGGSGGGVPGGPPTGAWDFTFGSGAKIAILDTGVSPIHPDIAPNLVFNASFATTPLRPSVAVCDDGSPVDQFGHGTWVATIAAGALGGGAVIGLAPQARIFNIKVLRREPFTGPLPPSLDNPFDRCRLGRPAGLFSWIVAGSILAHELGADVLNMAFGALISRVQNGAAYACLVRSTNEFFVSGNIMVASAGNSALDLDRVEPLVQIPAGLPLVHAVTATTNPNAPPAGCAAGTDCLASYSNFGSSLHGFAAPGGDVPASGPAGLGLIIGGCTSGIPGRPVGLPLAGGSLGCFSFPPSLQHSVFYVQLSGTSAAATHLSGTIALMRSINPKLSAADIRAILEQTAQDIGKPGYDQFFNFGLVNATGAVKAVASP